MDRAGYGERVDEGRSASSPGCCGRTPALGRTLSLQMGGMERGCRLDGGSWSGHGIVACCPFGTVGRLLGMETPASCLRLVGSSARHLLSVMWCPALL
ncbi:hypothetical protein ACLOJK_028271 [Asimina triloba]